MSTELDPNDDSVTDRRASTTIGLGRFRLPFASLAESLPQGSAAAPTMSESDLNDRQDSASASSLPLLSAAVGLLLLLSSFFRLHPLDTVPGMIGAGVTGLAGGALLITAGLLSRRKDLTDSAHQIAAAVLLVAAISLCVAMVASGSLAQTAYMELLIVAAGAVMLRTGWYLTALLSIWVLWLGVAAILSGTTDPAGWLLAMLGASVISIVIHTMRVDAIRALGGALLIAEAEAVRDALTGLLNRRGLDVVGREVLALARRSREPLSCTFIDIDGLKDVNDQFGHDSGDEVIREVADALTTVFRQADVIARWGGDEFIVIAVGAGPRVEDVERRIADRLGDRAVAVSGRWNGEVSAGRVVHMPWQDEELDAITERADQEMYRRRRLRRAKGADDGSSW